MRSHKLDEAKKAQHSRLWQVRFASPAAMAHRKELLAVLARLGVPIESMNTSRRGDWDNCVRDRRRVWAELRRMGWSYPRCAVATGTTHSTVLESLKVHADRKP